MRDRWWVKFFTLLLLCHHTSYYSSKREKSRSRLADARECRSVVTCSFRSYIPFIFLAAVFLFFLFEGKIKINNKTRRLRKIESKHLLCPQRSVHVVSQYLCKCTLTVRYIAAPAFCLHQRFNGPLNCLDILRGKKGNYFFLSLQLFLFFYDGGWFSIRLMIKTFT